MSQSSLGSPPPSIGLVSDDPRTTGSSLLSCAYIVAHARFVSLLMPSLSLLTDDSYTLSSTPGRPPNSPEHRRTSALPTAVHHVYLLCSRRRRLSLPSRAPLRAVSHAMPNLRSACQPAPARLVSRVPASKSSVNTAPPRTAAAPCRTRRLARLSTSMLIM